MKQINIFHYTHGHNDSGTISILAGCRADADTCAEGSSDVFANPKFKEVTRLKKPTIVNFTLDDSAKMMMKGMQLQAQENAKKETETKEG